MILFDYSPLLRKDVNTCLAVNTLQFNELTDTVEQVAIYTLQ